MFYSAELLALKNKTQMSVLYYMATTKKAKRPIQKYILFVDIKIAIAEIKETKIPFSLRLYSHLMMGLARIWVFQGEYLMKKYNQMIRENDRTVRGTHNQTDKGRHGQTDGGARQMAVGSRPGCDGRGIQKSIKNPNLEIDETIMEDIGEHDFATWKNRSNQEIRDDNNFDAMFDNASFDDLNDASLNGNTFNDSTFNGRSLSNSTLDNRSLGSNLMAMKEMSIKKIKIDSEITLRGDQMFLSNLNRERMKRITNELLGGYALEKFLKFVGKDSIQNGKDSAQNAALGDMDDLCSSGNSNFSIEDPRISSSTVSSIIKGGIVGINDSIERGELNELIERGGFNDSVDAIDGIDDANPREQTEREKRAKWFYELLIKAAAGEIKVYQGAHYGEIKIGA